MARVSGRRGAYRIALQVASYAVMSNESASAADLYEMAFADPHFAEDAAKDERLVRALLTASGAMLSAGRPLDALARFRQAERLHGGPVEGLESLRLAIEEAADGVRAQAGDAPPDSAVAREETRGARAGTPGGALGPLQGPDDARASPDRIAAPESVGTPAPWWAIAAAACAILAGTVAFVRRRRRGSSPPRSWKE
jgi:hypothetical protein